MATLLGYVLPFFAWRTRLPPEMEMSTTSPSPIDGAVNAAVQEPEGALLGQDKADLESGGLEAPPLTRQASDQSPVQDAAARTLQRRQLGTTANRTTGVTGEGEHRVGLTHRVTPLRSGGSAQEPAKLRQSFAYSFFIICLATGTLINLFVVRRTEEPLAKSPSLLAACASAFTSLISAIGLITFDTMKQIMTLPTRSRHLMIRDNTCSWSKLFFWMSTVSLASTVLSIIASFLPKACYILTVVLVPTLLLIVVSLSPGRRREDVLTLGDDDPHKDDWERSFQLAMNMTGFSFMGALGTKIGEHKNYSNRASPLYLNVSIYFMVGAAITGLVTLLFSRLQRRKDWKKTAVGNAIVLVLVVLAVLMIAATFLGGVLTATLLFPLAVAASIWFFFEYYVAVADLDAAFTREEEMKLLYTGAMTMMSVSFGAVMTIFSGFLGGDSKGGRLETLIFFVTLCFVSSVSLGVVTFRPPKKASVGAVAMALAFLALMFLVLAALAMVSYVG